MPFEPIRFIHASNLCLDCQLRGIGKPADDHLEIDGHREIIENATITAFERVIAASIEQHVDFVLLTGNSFDERDRSLRAQIALLDGFHRLAEHGIRVFVLPGEIDPADAWWAIPQLPDNVTTFFDRSSGAVAVLRNGKVIASVACSDSSDGAKPSRPASPVAISATSRREPFRIGLSRLSNDTAQPAMMASPPDGGSTGEDANPARSDHPPAARVPAFLERSPFDYLALGGPNRRRTFTANSGIAHNPAATQSLNRLDTGPHGCSLVEVDADGKVDCQFVPTAVVRREYFAIGIDGTANWESLLGKMQSLLDRQTSHPTESLWVIDWTLAGSVSICNSLCGDGTSRHFIERVGNRLHSDRLPQMLHSLQVLPDREAVEAARCDNQLAGDYFAELDINVPLTREVLVDCLQNWSDDSGGDVEDRRHRLIDEVDRRTILGKAREYGIRQFARPEELDA